MSINQEWELLKKSIEHHDHLYFNLQQPVIADEVYDILKRRFLWLSSKIGHKVDKVGAALTVPQITHDKKMLSLYSDVGIVCIKKWVERITKGLWTPSGTSKGSFAIYPVAVQHKIDGLAISLKYINGELIYGATRGDGTQGEDVTFNIRRVSTIPKNISIKSNICVRGEIYIGKAAFAETSHEFNSARNAASGIVRKINSSDAEIGMLQFFAYEIVDLDNHYDTYSDVLRALSQNFHVPDTVICNSCEECVEQYHLTEKIRDTIPYCIDGVVYKITDMRICEAVGYTATIPRWALATKFAPYVEITRVRDIVFQVGRTGLITPVVEIDPIKINDRLLSRAGMFNLKLLQEKDIRIHDTIVMACAGDVIPYIQSVMYDLRTGDEIVVKIPNECPSCGQRLVHEESLSRCVAGLNCTDQVKLRILHFIQAIGIKNLSESHVENFYNLGLLCSISDLFNLNKEKILALPGWGKKSWERIASQLTRPIRLTQAINALGILGVGEVTAATLAAFFQSWNKFLVSRSLQLASIEGIGEKIAQNIVDFLLANKELTTLMSAKLQILDEIKRVVGGEFAGQKWAITGELFISRNEIVRHLEAQGVQVVPTVTKATNKLIRGAQPGSKVEEAKKLGIEIVDEEWLRRLIM